MREPLAVRKRYRKVIRRDLILMMAVWLSAAFTMVMYTRADEAAGQETESSSAAPEVDPDSYVIRGSDVYSLSEEDILPLSSQELCYARNEIYARHGFLFSSAELQQFFDQKNWYWGSVPSDHFSGSVLSDCERSNITLISEREDAVGAYVTDLPGYSYAGVGSYSVGEESSADSEYLFPDSDSRYLTDAEVSGLSLRDICYAKNEIYARRGYIFQSQELQDYFGSKSWYTPTIPAASFSFSMFNTYEAANVQLLQSYEYYLNPNGYTLN